MLKTFAQPWLEEFWHTGKHKRVPTELTAQLLRKMDMLNRAQQIKDLEATIEKTPCDTVVIATPIDLSRIVKIKKPTVKVGYDLQEIGKPDLTDVLGNFVTKHKLVKGGKTSSKK